MAIGSDNNIGEIRLWFGLAGPAVAWLALGFTDLLIVWFECAYREEYMKTGPHPYARAACFVLGVILLLAATAAGATSYRSWRRISGVPHFSETIASDVREFIAFVGVIVSITLGAGIIWLSLPPLMIQFCARTK
jgi:hypothetical protein